MQTSSRAPSTDRIEIRRLETPEEYRAAEDVQRAAWGFTTDGPVPVPIERAMNDNGGLALGAYNGEAMVGFVLGFLGREGDTLYHYSHMTGVRPEYQNQGLGVRLKQRQREEVLAQGLSEIRWTFDPLQSKNAFFNVHRLGGRPDRYHPNYYGAMADALNEGLESDRLRLIWSLRSPLVEARARDGFSGTTGPEADWRSAVPVLETAVGPQGIRRPVAVRPPTQGRLQLEVPADLASVRQRDPGSGRRWRELTREAFTGAFAAGYRVVDFVSVTGEAERRAFYLLDRGADPDAP